MEVWEGAVNYQEYKKWEQEAIESLRKQIEELRAGRERLASMPVIKDKLAPSTFAVKPPP